MKKIKLSIVVFWTVGSCYKFFKPYIWKILMWQLVFEILHLSDWGYDFFVSSLWFNGYFRLRQPISLYFVVFLSSINLDHKFFKFSEEILNLLLGLDFTKIKKKEYQCQTIFNTNFNPESHAGLNKWHSATEANIIESNLLKWKSQQ